MVEDKVQGRVTWSNKDLDDFVLLRSDGNPTYMLAVVVDDHDMGITHVIRGDDHLTNAARQTRIFEALGWTIPVWSHIPLIHGPDGAKLSKRHGALGVDAYRGMGYLPYALRNYLVRLGWSQGDREFFTTPEMIEAFNLSGIRRSAARFDFAKLENVDGHYMRASSCEALMDVLEKALPYLPNRPADQFDAAMRAKLLAAMPGLKERAKTLVELLDGAAFLFAVRPLPLDEKASALIADGRHHIVALLPRFARLADWTASVIEAEVRAYVAETHVKLGQVAQAAASGSDGSRGVAGRVRCVRSSWPRRKPGPPSRSGDQVGRAAPRFCHKDGGRVPDCLWLEGR